MDFQVPSKIEKLEETVLRWAVGVFLLVVEAVCEVKEGNHCLRLFVSTVLCV